MARSKVTIEALVTMSEKLRSSAESILSTKDNMDRQLVSFVWDDPVAVAFKGQYEEELKPITDKLLPNIKSYLVYLENIGVAVDEYAEASHIHISGTEDIVGVLPKGTRPNPIVLDHDAVPHIPDEPLQPIDSSSDVPVTEDPIPVEGGAFMDTDFEARISGMDEESLGYLKQTYQEYSDLSGMAGYSYQDGVALPAGWEDLGQQDPNIQRIINDVGKNGGDASGLKFSVLKKTGEDRYVIAFAGTDFPKDWNDGMQRTEFFKDAQADVQGMFSQDEEQIKAAKKAVQELCRQGGVPMEKMEFTGHSLGGRLAAEMSVQYARPATTFNAAGVSETTRTQYEYLVAHSRSNYTGVRNVVTEHDFLTNLQSMGSGAKNPYIAAIPKEEIKIVHETISGTLSSTEGAAAKQLLDVASPLGASAGAVIDGVDKTFEWANRFNEYYNRDYRALGGTVVLADGKSGISGEAHGINVVKSLLDQRKSAIEHRLIK